MGQIAHLGRGHNDGAGRQGLAGSGVLADDGNVHAGLEIRQRDRRPDNDHFGTGRGQRGGLAVGRRDADSGERQTVGGSADSRDFARQSDLSDRRLGRGGSGRWSGRRRGGGRRGRAWG